MPLKPHHTTPFATGVILEDPALLHFFFSFFFFCACVKLLVVEGCPAPVWRGVYTLHGAVDSEGGTQVFMDRSHVSSYLLNSSALSTFSAAPEGAE